MSPLRADVVVAGAGIAGLSAAIAAREQGASVIVLECAPLAERGGNTRFSNGAMRAVYDGVVDLESLTGTIEPAQRARTDFGSYTAERYRQDMRRIAGERCDPAMVDAMIGDSAATLRWLHGQGVPFAPLYAWQFKTPDGRIVFQGGSALEAGGGGEGLSAALFEAAARAGVVVHYDATATRLLRENGAITGIMVRRGETEVVYAARAVVLACGGFEANADWRLRNLGSGWDAARVRGSRLNTGGGIAIAINAGAQPAGAWSACHAASWDYNAPAVNELRHGTIWKRDDFMYGIVVNARGERFFDEGADIRAVTYARLGRAVLAQPGHIAWQVFDAVGDALLHEEYRDARAARMEAQSLDGLAGHMTGIDRQRFLETVAAYNAAIRADVPFDPAAKDGRSTAGLAVPRSNWANPLLQPPFVAYPVCCGITFTFGGVAADADGRVLDRTRSSIPGLFAAGEMVGGMFYDNYPGGSGLMAAAVQGRRAGAAAAHAAA